MLFPTMVFAIFFLIVFFTAWSLDREHGRRKAFLLLASWVFYGWWDWRFVGLLIASATLNWLVAELIFRARTQRASVWLVALGVTINLLILGFFKYFGFFVDQNRAPLQALGFARGNALM